MSKDPSSRLMQRLITAAEDALDVVVDFTDGNNEVVDAVLMNETALTALCNLQSGLLEPPEDETADTPLVAEYAQVVHRTMMKGIARQVDEDAGYVAYYANTVGYIAAGPYAEENRKEIEIFLEAIKPEYTPGIYKETFAAIQAAAKEGTLPEAPLLNEEMLNDLRLAAILLFSMARYQGGAEGPFANRIRTAAEDSLMEVFKQDPAAYVQTMVVCDYASSSYSPGDDFLCVNLGEAERMMCDELDAEENEKTYVNKLEKRASFYFLLSRALTQPTKLGEAASESFSQAWDQLYAESRPRAVKLLTRCFDEYEAARAQDDEGSESCYQVLAKKLAGLPSVATYRAVANNMNRPVEDPPQAKRPLAAMVSDIGAVNKL